MMADDLTDAIVTNAQGPAEAHGDSGGMKQHSLPDVIEADKYVRAVQGVSKRNRGVRFSRIVPPGTVSENLP
jgi:hypothetical protein